jgi:AcrR family transcriptional regulator
MPKLSDSARAERKQRLVDAAWHCLSSQSFASLTVDDVCTQAGQSKGSFYGYFASKNELLRALLEDDSARLNQVMEELERKLSEPLERIRGFAQAMVARGSDPAAVQITVDVWVTILADQAIGKRFAELAAARRVRLRKWIAEAIAKGDLSDIPDNAFAATLLALGDGLVLQSAVNPSGFRWSNISKVLDALLRGVTPG